MHSKRQRITKFGTEVVLIITVIMFLPSIIYYSQHIFPSNITEIFNHYHISWCYWINNIYYIMLYYRIFLFEALCILIFVLNIEKKKRLSRVYLNFIGHCMRKTNCFEFIWIILTDKEKKRDFKLQRFDSTQLSVDMRVKSLVLCWWKMWSSFSFFYVISVFSSYTWISHE